MNHFDSRLCIAAHYYTQSFGFRSVCQNIYHHNVRATHSFINLNQSPKN